MPASKAALIFIYLFIFIRLVTLFAYSAIIVSRSCVTRHWTSIRVQCLHTRNYCIIRKSTRQANSRRDLKMSIIFENFKKIRLCGSTINLRLTPFCATWMQKVHHSSNICRLLFILCAIKWLFDIIINVFFRYYADLFVRRRLVCDLKFYGNRSPCAVYVESYLRVITFYR